MKTMMISPPLTAAAEERSDEPIRILRGTYAPPPSRARARTRPAPLLSTFFLRHLLVLLLLLSPPPARTLPDPPDDPYRILGVRRAATSVDIKGAYRRKARDTHPDKNPGMDPDEAAAEFRRVVDAFELLSDEDRRSVYDRSGQTGSGGGGGGGGGGTWTHKYANYNRHQHRRAETSEEREKRLMRNRRDVRRAKARVMHISSLRQLRNVILNESTGLLERSLLLCFVAPGSTDRTADDDVLFPYPFAGMSPQKIWWEDLLQTALVRYSGTSDLTRHFGLPPADELTDPVFVFVRRGSYLHEYVKLSTSTRKTYESWVWENLSVKVHFVNNHTHPVEIYWVYGDRGGEVRGIIQPGWMHTEFSRLSHEFWVRDERVDTPNPEFKKLSVNSSLGVWKILSDERETFVINTRCADLSGHCEFWEEAAPGECRRNAAFMRSNCKRTCQACGEDEPLFVGDWPGRSGVNNFL